MDRPSRNRKAVNYSDFLDGDDEDFATVKAPPNKKPRVSVKEPLHEKNWETPSNFAEIIDMTGAREQGRASLDEKLYKRDLEAALSLSLLKSIEKVDPLTDAPENGKCQPPVLLHCSIDGSYVDDNESFNLSPCDSPPVLSNCSVDISCFGLNQITSEHTSSGRQRTTSETTEHQRQALQNRNDHFEDEDYKPQNTPESDADFSDQDETEDEEFTVNKKGEEKKMNKNKKKTAPKTVKKEKNTPKVKAKPQAAGSMKALSRTPVLAQSVPALNSSPVTPPAPKHGLGSSPAGGRLPKWNPPGLLGNSSTLSQSPQLKSTGLGLRLGLSRLAKVKPLHSNTAAH